MKIVGQYGEGYRILEESPGGGFRRIQCTTCTASWASGYASWLGGIVERTTHLRLLQEKLGRDCKYSDCPHPKEGLVK